MANEPLNNKENLIDVSEFESELTGDALTEIAHTTEEEEEEEVTPIQKRPLPITPVERKPTPLLQVDTPTRGTFICNLKERFAAFFIDTLILFYFYWLYAPVYGRIFIDSWHAPIPISGWHGLAFHGSFLLFCFLYYFMLEAIFLATIGKFVCWMSIRKKDGQPATIPAAFIRNILRIIDYIFIVPVIFLMDLTKYKQRLGDIFARTTVVKKFVTAPRPYKISPEIIASATSRTIAIIIDCILFLSFLAGYALLLSPKYPLISQWMILLIPIVFIAYFVLIEMTTETSPGKWIMGLIICENGGRRLTISSSITRTLWKIFDTNPIGILCIFTSPYRQRPGDTAGGTLVIKNKRKTKGVIAFFLAITLAALFLYAGLSNKNNMISKTFKVNFLPNISFLKNLGYNTTKPGVLQIKNFRFSANDTNNLRVPATFKAGETVYLVFEIEGYSKQDRKVWIQEDISVRYPDGSIGINQTNYVDSNQVVKGTAPIELINNIPIPNDAKHGIYQVNIVIRDKYSGRELNETHDFFIRRPFGS